MLAPDDGNRQAHQDVTPLTTILHSTACFRQCTHTSRIRQADVILFSRSKGVPVALTSKSDPTHHRVVGHDLDLIQPRGSSNNPTRQSNLNIHVICTQAECMSRLFFSKQVRQFEVSSTRVCVSIHLW